MGAKLLQTMEHSTLAYLSPIFCLILNYVCDIIFGKFRYETPPSPFLKSCLIQPQVPFD